MTDIGVGQQLLIGIGVGLIVLLIVKIIEFTTELVSGHKIPKSRKSKILLIALVAFVVLVVVCRYQPSESPQIQITTPNEGDYVPLRYTVKGTSNIDPNSDLNIYVFIWARNWYVQPKATISSNGDWETRDRCRFGKPEYEGLNYTYDICAIVTTKDFEVDEQFANLPDYKAKSEIIGVTRE